MLVDQLSYGNVKFKYNKGRHWYESRFQGRNNEHTKSNETTKGVIVNVKEKSKNWALRSQCLGLKMRMSGLIVRKPV